MIENYLKIAIRNLRRQLPYALINITGLAVGLACCLLISIYVLDELSFEHFHDNANQIVRVVEDQETEGVKSQVAYSFGPIAPILEDEIPAVEDAVRFFPYPMLVNIDASKQFQEDDFVFVDSTFLEVFSFPLQQGNSSIVLDEPFSLVLTASTAIKYFGVVDPVGKTLEVRDDEGTFVFTITGVLDDLPTQTHFAFDMLASMGSLSQINHWAIDPENWEHPSLYTYALLRPDTDIQSISALLPQLALDYMGAHRVATRSLHFEKLTDIHLRSGRENDLSPGSNIAYVYIFSIIALFILLIACINFVNLATAQSVERAKEVGMRKTLGALRIQVVQQFLTEAMLMVAVAVLIAGGLVYVMMPAFNELSGKSIETMHFLNWTTPLLLVVLVLFIGLFAGGYPAFYLSRFLPVKVLKGTRSLMGASDNILLRKGLVVFQFVISISLLIGVLVVNQQLAYLQGERLGFNKEHVVIVPLRDQENVFNYEPLKTVWEQVPGVQHVSASSGMPGIGLGVYDFMIKPVNALQDSLEMLTLTVDHDFVETYGMEIVAGRDFSENFSTDATEAFLINETAAIKLGWDNPLGQQLTLRVWFNGEVQKKGTIVGVLKDFQYNSLHKAITPMMLHIFPNTYYNDYLSVRLTPENPAITLSMLEEAWRNYNPSRPFEYSFLDEKFDALYRTEARMGQLFGAFALIALLIGCLGLFGLASFMARRRVKEIGIRKVLGAGVMGIIGLLSNDFLKLVSIAFVISIPIAYFALNHWLNGFAERIDLGVSVFAVAGLIALVIAFTTVSYQAYRAAVMDPVKALRYE